jgi:hypothetical protein
MGSFGYCAPSRMTAKGVRYGCPLDDAALAATLGRCTLPAMRALMELVEGDHHIVRTSELSAVAPEVLVAARRAGILRPDDPGLEDISATDLARVLRALYGLSSRGRPVPTSFVDAAATLGWMGTGDDAREVLFCARPRTGLSKVLDRRLPTLVLVPTARHLTPQLRERHAPGAPVVLEALEEALVSLGGRFVRRAAIAPDAPGIDVAAVERMKIAPTIVLRGVAKHWTDLRICLLDSTSVRVDAPGRSLRCTHVDFGMAHGRTRRPTLAWEVLEEVCLRGGFFHTSRFGNANATKKLISRVRRDLQQLFDIPGSPFHRYRSDCGWRSRFKTRPDLPEDHG